LSRCPAPDRLRLVGWARFVLVGVLSLVLVACGSTPAAVEVRPLYQYTCCTKADVERIWMPGEPFALHWIAQSAPGTNAPNPRYVVLSAELVGPYPDASSLKKGGGAVRTLRAPDVTADTWQPEDVVSAISLPSDLPAGLYDLRFKVAIAGGSMGGASVVRVGKAAP
jgi:hypothetical protein